MSSNAPASDILSGAISNTLETINATKCVHLQKENFKKLASYLEKTASILQQLTKLNFNDSAALKTAINALTKHVSEAKTLAFECTTRNKIYLLLNSKTIVTTLEKNTKDLGGALTLLAPLFSFNGVGQEIIKLSNIMTDSKYRTRPVEDEIKEKIQLGIRERNADRSFTNNLLVLIADAIGISTEQSVLRTEYEEFKNEMENMEMTADVAESLQIEQIVGLLGKADILATVKERENKYFSKRNSLGRQPLEALQSFYCPITGDVMEDPVETPSGHSFERGAIEKWLAEENSLCPVTKTPLKTSALRTNKTLRQSIEEWRDRNTMIVIGSMKSRILSNEDEEVIICLGKLQDLLLERDLHQEWVMMEDYLPVLVSLLSTKNFQIRSRVLVILRILATNHDDRKERIAKTDDAIKLIVCSLARKIEESKLALQLLTELSDNDLARNMIGDSQGSILLLVTISGGDDLQAANDAKRLLDNLSFLNQNIVQMAKANYFGPLLHLLASGSESVQRLMVETLSELEMTDHGKLMVCENGTVELLVTMLSHDDIDMRKAAILALEKLSGVPQNGLKIIKQNATEILLGILFRESLSIPSLVEKIVATVMNLALSLTSQDADHPEILFLETEEEVYKLFSLISLHGPNVQQYVLRTFLAVCQSSSGLNIRKILRKICSVQVLVQLCEHENQTVRSNSVKLFCILTKDGDDEAFMEHVGPKCVDTLLKIINASDNTEEGVAAMEIISNLPRNPKMTQWILEAGALGVIISILSDHFHKPGIIIERASGALCRFTISSDQELQKKVAETGIITVLVNMLDSGTASTKKYIAVSLRQFSESSNGLSRPVERKLNLFACCIGSPDTGCAVHTGICTTESSFCLLEANAIKPLVKVLDEPDFGACEASLDALLTLVNGEQLLKGSKVLEGGGAIAKMVKLLSSPSVRLQEKTLVALERIFRSPEYKQKYKASAQMPLVEITQRGSSGMKSVAAKILAHLNVLHEQSSFF
ncbi:putative U box domain, armadillo-like helical, Zinc finger, RING/FYVE/PHD-type [Helianthus annuus]|nr:putative U box domain, armadillo-like helical, Zinc finger, RING/FYVE/PHD-type [Helianthus annuus]